MAKTKTLECKDLISVLVPMYNVEKTIARCVESILKQTYTNLEIVLLDDGSKDKTYEIAKSYADKDSRIKLLHKENERNLSKTRNYLLDNYSGDYVIWVDSDDVLQKNYVEKLYNAIIKYDADMACCRYKVQLANMPILKLKPTKELIFENEDIIPQMILNNKIYFVVYNKIYRKSLLQGVRFKDTVKYGEDLVYCLAYAKKCKKVVTISDKLYHYILRPGSEIRQKFSDKHISFINALEEIVLTEEDENIKSVIKAWLAFSCSTLTLLAKITKFKDKNYLNKMNYYSNLYMPDLLKNKKTKRFYKRVMRLGKITWAKPKAKTIYG
ncbi:MAG: glycosyltransferase family 2 protein [Clostridia bacterium]|nr:glycosyltransferase family 2 protein [Clostridia bacterium]